MTRVALLDHPDARRLAGELPQAKLVRPRGLRALDALLARRGFTGPLTHVPFAAAQLRRFDLVHAFTPVDAAAGRLAGRPVVFTCVEVLGRETVADRRLRLRLLGDAIESSDVVVAASEEARAALHRWMAVDAPVVATADEYTALYASRLDR